MTDHFTWQAERVDIPDVNFARIEEWLGRVADAHGRRIGVIGYIFCDDSRILEVNREFLQHDYYTDIITFDYCRGRMLRGDIYLSLDTVASNARMLGVSADRELLRVIVHGVLHLCGIDDKAPGARAVMESNEDAALAIWDSMDADYAAN